jgi:hypothetical protein
MPVVLSAIVQCNVTNECIQNTTQLDSSQGCNRIYTSRAIPEVMPELLKHIYSKFLEGLRLVDQVSYLFTLFRYYILILL